MDENPRTASSKLVVPALVLSRVAAQPHGLITALLLIEIAQTFNVPIGVAGQLSTAVSIVSVFIGLLMSFLAIKYSYRSLMLAGLASYIVSFVSSYIASDFATLLMTFSLIGVASSMVNPMTTAIVGDLILQEQRTKVIGWFQAGMAVCVLIGSPYIAYISGAWGWRTSLILFALPFALAALILVVYIGISGSSAQSGSNKARVSVTGGFKEILTNRSALSCIACSVLAETAWTVTPVYGITYMRQTTQLPLALSWLILVGTSTSFMLGGLTGGHLANRFGRLRLTIVSASIVGFLIMAYLNIALPIVAAPLVFASCFFTSLRYAASESLTMEQVPELRGSVMSLNSIALSVGSTVSTGLGGLLLLSYGYGGLGALGLFSVAAALLYRFSVVDPLKSDT